MKKELRTDLTTGNVFGTLLSFSIPYFFSYFLQTLYGMADLYIVGQFNAVESTTAVSIGSQIMHMITVMIVGLAMGTTVSIGHEVGARNEKRVFETIGNTVVLFLSLSVVAAVLLMLCIDPIVKVMSTPAEAVESTVSYLTICFIGIPFITAYNIISSIFRGLGDSKSPMYFIAVACISNIVLDFIFIGTLGMGAAGAALGTTLAQTISVAVALIRIKTDRNMQHIRLSGEDFRPKRAVMGKLLAIGVPVAVQDGLAAIEAVEKNTFDLILLDIMLPGADGYDVMEYIRPFKVPVIFISAKHEVKDRVKGLKLGADDYLIKPFDVTELLARVEAVLRRYNKTDKVITLGDVEIDVEARRVKRGGSPISLTSKEFDLMLLFVENRNVALFRENLYERVWDDEYFANSRTLDLHVQRLRRKLGWEKNLVAVYKVGYRLEL